MWTASPTQETCCADREKAVAVNMTAGVEYSQPPTLPFDSA